VRQAGSPQHTFGNVSCNAPPTLPHTHAGRNAFDGYTPSNPEGKRLDFGGPDFLQFEEGGLVAVGQAAFVLVAGGLGERLGYKGELGAMKHSTGFVCVRQHEVLCRLTGCYSGVEGADIADGTAADHYLFEPACLPVCLSAGIKVALPAESASGRCFLQLYIETILALQVRLNHPAFAYPPHDPVPSCAVLAQHRMQGVRTVLLTVLKLARAAGCVWRVSTGCAPAPGHHDK
jgi:hypothetical protein